MDERQKEIALKAMGLTLTITYIYLLAECFYKFFTTKEIFNCSWEIGLLVLIPSALLFFARKDEALLLPKTIKGRELSTGESKLSKKSRVKHYISNSIGFSIGMLIISAIVAFVGRIDTGDFGMISGFSKAQSYMICAALELITMFLVSFIIEYIISEYQIKKYNKQIKILEGECHE